MGEDVKDQYKHIVALSGGKDSTALALRLAEVEPREYIHAITPTGDELPEMYEHWKKLEGLLGATLTVLSKRSLKGEIQRNNSLPSWRMRFCTRRLKIEPFNEYILRAWPCVVYVGIRADESDREGNRVHGGIEQRFPLIEWGWGKQDVLDYLAARGVEIPPRTDCARCFYQTLPEWYSLYTNYPEIYKDAVRDEAITGHTFRSPQRDNWPAALIDLAVEFESGRIPKERATMEGRASMCGVCAR